MLDLSRLMPTNSIVGAVITGMFGIPTDPRLIEVLGWLLYAVPVLIVFLWPARLAPGAATKRRILAVTAASLAVTAAAMALVIPATGEDAPGRKTVATADGNSVSLRVDGPARVLVIAKGDGTQQLVRLTAAGQQTLDGLDVDVWQATTPVDPGLTSTPISLDQLAKLSGGRLPVGLGTARTRGPYDAQWSARTVYTVLAHGDDVVSAEAASTRVATLSGGGLTGPRTVSVGGLATDWATTSGADQAIAAQITQAARDRTERTLWTVWLPTVFAITAGLVALAAARTNRRSATKEREQHHGESPTRDEVRVS